MGRVRGEAVEGEQLAKEQPEEQLGLEEKQMSVGGWISEPREQEVSRTQLGEGEGDVESSLHCRNWVEKCPLGPENRDHQWPC